MSPPPCFRHRGLRPFTVVPMLVLALVIVLAVPASAARKKYREGTVVLRSGERVEDVLFWVRDRYKVVVIQGDHETRRVSFTEIAEIWYRNVESSERLLGDRYPDGSEPAHQRETWRPAPPPSPRSPASPWTLGIGGGVIGTLPFGDYYAGIVEGIGWDASAFFRISDELALRAQADHPGLRSGRSPRVHRLDPGLAFVSQDVTFSSWSVSVSIQRTFSAEGGPRTAVRYLYSGLGFTHHAARIDLVVREVATGAVLEAVAETDDANVTTTVGGGFVIPVTDEIGLDLGAYVDLAPFSSESDNGAIVPAILVGGRVGLLVLP